MADPLRLRISTDATIEEFERSAQEKYEAGFELVAEGFVGAGIYLLGYSAEMLLKAAYFRVLGLRDTDVVSARRLHGARRDAGALGVLADPEGLHSIEFWSQLLREKRAALATPLDPSLDGELLTFAQLTHVNWHFGMRYLPDSAYTVNADDVFAGVSWFITHAAELWR